MECTTLHLLHMTHKCTDRVAHSVHFAHCMAAGKTGVNKTTFILSLLHPMETMNPNCANTRARYGVHIPFAYGTKCPSIHEHTTNTDFILFHFFCCFCMELNYTLCYSSVL